MSLAAVILVASLHPAAAPADASTSTSAPAGTATTKAASAPPVDDRVQWVLGLHAPVISTPQSWSSPEPFVGLEIPLGRTLAFITTLRAAGGSSALDGDGLDTWRGGGQIDGGLRWNAITWDPRVVSVHGAVGPEGSFVHGREPSADGIVEQGWWTVGVGARVGMGIGLALTDALHVDLGVDLLSAHVYSQEARSPAMPAPYTLTGADLRLTLAPVLGARVAL